MNNNLLHENVLDRLLKNNDYSFYKIAFQRRYYDTRYQDPKTSRWLSTDPALGEYIPGAPINDEVRKQNGNLPGMGGVFNTVNLHLYHYAGNNPVKYTDPDGKENISYINLIVFRDRQSPRSAGEGIFQQRDYAMLKNLKTGEQIFLFGGQTVSNHSGYPVENTIQAFSGGFKLQYLGNNQEKDQSLYNKTGSVYKGPILNIIEAITQGSGLVDKNGVIPESGDPTPFRVHSDTRVDDTKINFASGGCFIFPLKELEKMQDMLDKWGVKPGDTFLGWVDEEIEI